jgi:AcrR family transcriptional regulator
MARVSTQDADIAAATDSPRDRLLAAAVRLLEDSGPDALQARKLAAEIGASTMAVYTHFGGMRQLMGAIAREGFVRLNTRLAQVPETRDPVADLLRLGVAYRDHAIANPQLYRVMFGVVTAGGQRLVTGDMNEMMSSAEASEGRTAFEHLVRGVARVIEAGTGTPEDPIQAASQIWSATHGYVLLEIAGYFGEHGYGQQNVLLPVATKLISSLGHSPQAVQRSARSVAGTFAA